MRWSERYLSSGRYGRYVQANCSHINVAPIWSSSQSRVMSNNSKASARGSTSIRSCRFIGLIRRSAGRRIPSLSVTSRAAERQSGSDVSESEGLVFILCMVSKSDVSSKPPRSANASNPRSKPADAVVYVFECNSSVFHRYLILIRRASQAQGVYRGYICRVRWRVRTASLRAYCLVCPVPQSSNALCRYCRLRVYRETASLTA
jgi:hypothetical protein